MKVEGRVLTALAAETRFADVRLLDETGSTMDVAVDAAASGAAEGLVVCADFQTAGRGRLDRTWEARPGDGLLVSVLLRPRRLEPSRRALTASAVALAARAACLDVAGVEADLKWPNDLLARSGEKLAGILAIDASGAIVVGMGLNVHGGPPGSAWLDDLAGRRIGRADLLERWLRELDGLVDDWSEVAARYRAGCATVGRRVSVELPGGGPLAGVAEGVDDLGRLVVRADDGSITELAVGDVTHVR